MARVEEKTHARLYSCFTRYNPEGQNEIFGRKFLSTFKTAPFTADKDFMDRIVDLSVREGTRYFIEKKRFPLLIRAYAIKDCDAIAIRIDNQDYQLF